MIGRQKILPCGLACLCLVLSGCDTLLDLIVNTEVGVDPHHLQFAAVQGASPPEPQTIHASCQRYDDGIYRSCEAFVSSDREWLYLDKTSFYGEETVQVVVDPYGMPPGTHEGNIHLRYYPFAFDDEEDVQVEVKIIEQAQQ